MESCIGRWCNIILITGCCNCSNTVIVEIDDHKDYKDCKYICSECSSKSTNNIVKYNSNNSHEGYAYKVANTKATNSMGFSTKSIVSKEAEALGKLKELVCKYTIVN